MSPSSESSHFNSVSAADAASGADGVFSACSASAEGGAGAAVHAGCIVRCRQATPTTISAGRQGDDLGQKPSRSFPRARRRNRPREDLTFRLARFQQLAEGQPGGPQLGGLPIQPAFGGKTARRDSLQAALKFVTVFVHGRISAGIYENRPPDSFNSSRTRVSKRDNAAPWPLLQGPRIFLDGSLAKYREIAKKARYTGWRGSAGKRPVVILFYRGA